MSHSKITQINYEKLVYRICFILLTSFVLGYVIPGVISYNTHGYTKRHLFERLDKTKLDARSKAVFLKRDSMSKEINKKIELLKANNDSSIHTRLEQIKDYESLRERVLTEPNMRLTAFADSRISLMWPILLSALLIICFVILPFRVKVDWVKFPVLFAIVAVIMFVPNYIRNSKFGDDGRVIFSVFNSDINPIMHNYQLFLYLIMIVVLIIIWLKCEYATKVAIAYKFDEYTFDGITEDLSYLKSEYYRWQIFSIALFALFGSLLYHFYHIVFIEGDMRYLFQTIFFNFLYLFTWILGSLPLYIKFKNWDTFKQRILYDRETEKMLVANSIDVQELRKFIPPYEIASSVNQAVSIFLSSISFFLPLLRILTQR